MFIIKSVKPFDDSNKIRQKYIFTWHDSITILQLLCYEYLWKYRTLTFVFLFNHNQLFVRPTHTKINKCNSIKDRNSRESHLLQHSTSKTNSLILYQYLKLMNCEVSKNTNWLKNWYAVIQKEIFRLNFSFISEVFKN